MKEISQVSSSLFGTPSKGLYAGGDRRPYHGYLYEPLEREAACITDGDVDKLHGAVDYDYLTFLNISTIALARSFNEAKSYALEEMLQASSIVKRYHDNVVEIMGTEYDKRIKVKSTILSDMFNTKMVHTGAMLGLYAPMAFLNHNFPKDRKTIVTEP